MSAVNEADEWDEWLRDWRLALSTHKAASTVTAYQRAMSQFKDWFTEEYPDAGLGDLTRRHVEGWLAYLADNGRGPSTRRARMMSLSAFFRWMVSEPGSPLTVNPVTGVTAPTATLSPVQAVTDADVTAVLRTCERQGATFVDLRDAAMIRVMAGCGVRRAELVGLDVTDLDLDRGDILVRKAKGSRPRLVSISGTKTTLSLSRYLRARRRHPAAASPALFVATRMSASGGWRLTGGAVAEMLKRRCALAGVEPIHPHALRHSWADAAKRAGVSGEDLMVLGGWSDLSMVARYGRALADERARDAHRATGVGDRV